MIKKTVRKPLTITTDPSLLPAPLCDCTHHNWLTCWAEKHHTSRFNAMFITTTRTVHLSGHCDCPCHQDANKQQVSEQDWIARVRREYKPDRRSPRRRNQDVALKFVAEPAPFVETRGRKSRRKVREARS